MAPSPIYLILALSISPAFGVIQVPSYFGNGMVLQQEPQTAHVWGTTDDTESDISILLTCQGGTIGEFLGQLVNIKSSQKNKTLDINHF